MTLLKMAIRPICVSYFKGETQINDQLTGYGHGEYNVQANTTEGEGANSSTRLAFAGLKFGDYGSFDYGQLRRPVRRGRLDRYAA